MQNNQIKALIMHLKQFLDWFDLKVLFPVMKWISGFLSKRLEKRVKKYNLIYDWKEKTIEDFRYWIADISDEIISAEKIKPESCDFFTLLSEFTALRQEIRIQNREQNSTLKTLTSANNIINSFQELSTIFKDKIKELQDFEQRIRINSEKKVIMPFLEVRDALSRGLESARDKLKQRFFLKKNKLMIEGIVEGYEMAIRRFDRSLSYVNIHPVTTLGQPFDPKNMKAVDKRFIQNAEKGVVIEEYLTGFIRENEILRIAEVVVNE